MCTGTTGPGISNLLTGVMAAHADRVPMLVLTPQVAQAKQGRGALQDSSGDGYDMTRVLRECTRYSTNVTHPGQLAHKLRRALIALHSKPQGPVHLSIASDILAALTDPTVEGTRVTWVPGPLIDESAVAQLVKAVQGARAPAFYVGDDAGAEAERLIGLARNLGGVVVSSPAGKRWIGHCDPVYAGVLGFSGHEEAGAAVLASDLIVAFGASFDELSTNAWSTFGAARWFAVDSHAEHVHRLAHAQPVIATTGHVIDRVAGELRGAAGAASGRPPKCVNPHRPVRASLSPEGAVHPAALMDWLNQQLPEDVVVYADAGNSFSWSTRHLQRPLPATYQVAMGLSSMCWALGAVVGASIARPRRTLCITGDGSMLMASLELTVAVQLGLPITYVVLNVRCGQAEIGVASPVVSGAPLRSCPGLGARGQGARPRSSNGKRM